MARDLVRLVRAVETGAGLDALSGLQRAQLDAVRRALVKITTELAGRPALGEEVLRLKAYLGATRSGILAELSKTQRIGVLQALLAIEVGEGEVRAVLAPPTARGSAAVRAAVASASRRVAARARGELRRRREEGRSLDPSARLGACFAVLPRVWRQAIWRAAGFAGRPSPEGMERCLLTPESLAATLETLRPAERAALALVVRGGGIALARNVEDRFGDSSGDGFDWHRERPTSVLGRLRLSGLVTVGRLSVPGNPRSRPRVVFLPVDLREPVATALAALEPPEPRSPAVPAHIVDEVVGEDEPQPGEAPFDHAQPELFRFVLDLSRRLSRRVKPAVPVKLAATIWRAFERAHPRRVPRAREPHVERARDAALDDLAAVETTHLRVLQRRVVRMLTAQPHLYAHIASFLEVSPWPEADKLVVFHACDVTLRALHGLVSDD